MRANAMRANKIRESLWMIVAVAVVGCSDRLPASTVDAAVDLASVPLLCQGGLCPHGYRCVVSGSQGICERSDAGIADATADASPDLNLSPPDTRLSDSQVNDSQVSDGSVADPFCRGTQVKAAFDNTAVSALSIKSEPTITSCCNGELITLSGSHHGHKLEIGLAPLRFVGYGYPTSPVDLAQPPGGWTLSLRCDPYADCVGTTPDVLDVSGVYTHALAKPVGMS
ncbi:MAG: hypothetical protein H6707_12390 [Deltaproteobacteria bacterium]|nr:hypothetical protein [Deltaproteobacteria bacterium]